MAPIFGAPVIMNLCMGTHTSICSTMRVLKPCADETSRGIWFADLIQEGTFRLNVFLSGWRMAVHPEYCQAVSPQVAGRPFVTSTPRSRTNQA